MKINARLSAMAAVWLIIGAPSALAASDTELTVTGFITPGACEPNLSANGIVDYGDVPLTQLDPGKPTWLPPVTLQMTITCEEKTKYALMPRDNRPEGQPYSAYNGFGLTMFAPDIPIGAYFLSVPTPPLADGVPIGRLYSVNNGDSWLPVEPFELLKPDTLSAFGTYTGSDTAPTPIKELILPLELSTLIYQTRDLPVTEKTPIDGSATFELIYL
ncbi:DUF1120 domain-containing protein [Pseudomonas migulae]|uniref:DUF1120 domain-containing protein n=1 Tax=Pseudomonas migulae TaxID=78543 RepID=UPI00371D4577